MAGVRGDEKYNSPFFSLIVNLWFKSKLYFCYIFDYYSIISDSISTQGMNGLLQIYYFLIFPLNNPLSLSFSLFPPFPFLLFYVLFHKKNVLLDVFLCIKDFKFGKSCLGALVISYLYSHTHTHGERNLHHYIK